MCTRDTLTFEGIIRRLTTFELSNFEKYKLDNIESSFKAKMIVRDTEEVQTKKKNEIGRASCRERV